MAIKIPSKNIYEINNPKIRDNMIDNVSVEQTVVKPNNEYETPVYNEDISNLSLKSQKTINEDLQETYVIDTSFGVYIGACAYVGYNSQKYHEQKVYIPKLKDNSFINKLLLGVDDNDNQNIKTTFIGTKNKGTTSGTWYGKFKTDFKFDLIVTKGEINYSQPTETKTDERYDIPKEISYTYQSNNRGNPTATAKLIDIGNLSTISFNEETKDDIEYYTLQLKILCGIRIVYMGGYDDGMASTISNCPFVMSGSYEEYIPTQIEITIYGNTIGIDLTDGSVTYGSGNKPFSLERNELLQDSANSKIFIKTDSVDVEIGGELSSAENISYLEMVTTHNFNIGDIITNYDGTETAEITYYDSSNGFYEIKVTTDGYFYQNIGKNIIVKHLYYQEKRLTQHLAENVLNQYANGKETATLLCDINEYYDENGNLVISTKNNSLPITFKIGDIVIPYVYGADGQDYPMSKYQNGQPKQFRVCGAKKIYDGAVWQELTLQETT